MVNKIIVCYIGGNCENCVNMSLESIKEADKILFIYDITSKDNTFNKLKKWKEKLGEKLEIIERAYEHDKKDANGKARNFYLNILKEKYKDWFVLVLDLDEVVDNFSKIQEFINILPEQNHDILFSIKMRHFIDTLGTEDASQLTHFVPHRLFKVRENLKYDNTEHPVLYAINKEGKQEFREANIMPTVIWHLGYIPNLFYFKERYITHLKKSEMHSPQFLKDWYYRHIFNAFPVSRIDLMDIPKIILEEFGVDKDELYFAPRMQLEAKHFLMCKNWNDYFNPFKILDIGCGVGHYGFAFKFINPKIDYLGVDKSKWIIENTPYKDLMILQRDITKGISLLNNSYDLILCIDILEHLNYKELDFVLSYLPELGKYFIFSLPFLGDIHLEDDKTHIIKETKEWWINILSQYFKISETPKNWLFNEQILIGERK